jgi:hypothetical protein
VELIVFQGEGMGICLFCNCIFDGLITINRLCRQIQVYDAKEKDQQSDVENSEFNRFHWSWIYDSNLFSPAVNGNTIGLFFFKFRVSTQRGS